MAVPITVPALDWGSVRESLIALAVETGDRTPRMTIVLDKNGDLTCSFGWGNFAGQKWSGAWRVPFDGVLPWK